MVLFLFLSFKVSLQNYAWLPMCNKRNSDGWMDERVCGAKLMKFVKVWCGDASLRSRKLLPRCQWDHLVWW